MKNRKGAVIGAVAGSVSMAVLSLPINYFITYPAYIKFYHMPLEQIIAAYQAIMPTVKASLVSCLCIFNMPFTLMKGLIVALVCFLIYMPLYPVLNKKMQ